jgi:hypothetical protein
MREVAKVKSGSCPCAPTCGIRTAVPRGAVVTFGVWSLLRHHTRCRVRALATGTSCLSGGCD